MRFWLGPWTWQTDPEGGDGYWSAPAGSVGSLDLRSVPQCAARQTASGFGLFVTANAANLGSDYRNLGTDPEAILSEQVKRVAESALALPATLAANRLHDVLWEVLTIQADPIGDDRAPPIVPTTRREYELWIAGHRARSKRWRGTEDEAAPVIDLFKRQYRQLRADARDGQLRDAVHHLRVLDYWRAKYACDYRLFIPADCPDEGLVEHETTISDAFTNSDGTSLDAHSGLTWTEVVENWDILSNTARLNHALSAGLGFARAEHDLSSADHYATCDTAALGVNVARYIAPCARYAAGADTNYHARMGGTGIFRLLKRVTGSNSNLGTETTETLSIPDTIRVECNGSTIAIYFNGALKDSVTDTSITANTRAGISANSGSTKVRLDNFEAADLAAGPDPQSADVTAPAVAWAAAQCTLAAEATAPVTAPSLAWHAAQCTLAAANDLPVTAPSLRLTAAQCTLAAEATAPITAPRATWHAAQCTLTSAQTAPITPPALVWGVGLCTLDGPSVPTYGIRTRVYGGSARSLVFGGARRAITIGGQARTEIEGE